MAIYRIEFDLKGDRMTKHEIITDEIRKKILNGEYKVNTQIPLEKELCEAYKVSRITIKKAIDQLVLEGLVVKRRRAGTFVKGVADEGDGEGLHQMNGLFRTGDKINLISEVLKLEIILPPAEVAEKLMLSKEEFVYDIIRYRHNGKSWAVIEYTYMPINLIPGITKSVLEKSVYHYIEHELKLRIQSGHRIVRAIPPRELEKKYLNMKETDPVLEIEQVGFLDTGVPFEYSHSCHRGDCYEFRTVCIR